MTRMHCPPPRRLAQLLLAGAALGAAGCLPGTAWMPDSSGLVYTAGKELSQLVHYDLARNERRVLVADTGAPTLWPAVSPDGKQIAIAKLIFPPNDKQTRLQVIIYDLQGKELHRSAELPWAMVPRARDEKSPPDPQSFPQLFWAPAGGRVVVHTFGHVGIYDTKEGKKIHSGPGALLVFRGGPTRADGAGFVVMKNPEGWMSILGDRRADDTDPRFTFVRWDGRERSILAPPLMVDAQAMKREKDVNKLMALFNPLLFDSGWNREVAHVSYNTDRLRYYTDRGEALMDAVKPEVTDDGLVWARYRFPDGKATLRTIGLVSKDGKADGASAVRVQVLKAGQKEPELVIDRTEVCVPSVSPCGRLVALRFWTAPPGGNGPRRDNLIVVNATGEVVVNLQAP